MKIPIQIFIGVFACITQIFYADGQPITPFVSKTLTEKVDLSSLMVEGIDRFLTEKTIDAQKGRSGLWQRDFSSPQAFSKSITFYRDFLARRLGIVDIRVTPEIEVLTSSQLEQLKVETGGCLIRPVRWKVLDGLQAEGLLLQPKGKTVARIVMIPDAEILPEVLAGIKFIVPEIFKDKL